MKILITGAHGFVASGLVRYLSHHDITALGHVEFDVTSAQQVKYRLEQTRYDLIVNCAVSGRHRINDIDSAIYQDNVQAAINFATNQTKFGCYINIGSGSEFDTQRNINSAHESEIWYNYPRTSYALSKNAVARMLTLVPNAWTVRVFGCADSITPDYHWMTKLRNSVSQGIEFSVTMDRMYDMISVRDLSRLIEYIAEHRPHYRDINAVYDQKITLSDIFRVYCKLHGFDSDLISVESVSDHCYTGAADRLKGLPIMFEGLEMGLGSHR